jgi:hypothetical protein
VKNRRTFDQVFPDWSLLAESHLTRLFGSMLREDRVAGAAGGTNGMLMDKLGRWKAEQGAVRRESPARADRAVLESGRKGEQGAIAASASGPQ